VGQRSLYLKKRTELYDIADRKIGDYAEFVLWIYHQENISLARGNKEMTKKERCITNMTKAEPVITRLSLQGSNLLFHLVNQFHSFICLLIHSYKCSFTQISQTNSGKLTSLKGCFIMCEMGTIRCATFLIHSTHLKIRIMKGKFQAPDRSLEYGTCHC
jgi:hypothetical protein